MQSQIVNNNKDRDLEHFPISLLKKSFVTELYSRREIRGNTTKFSVLKMCHLSGSEPGSHQPLSTSLFNSLFSRLLSTEICYHYFRVSRGK